MNFYFWLINVLFFIWTVRNILFWAYLWQLKEYRLDRVIIHLRETGQGKRLFLSPLLILKLILILSYAFVVANNNLFLPYQLFVILVFGVHLFNVGKEIYLSILKKPVLTLKSTSLIFFSILIIFLFSLFSPLDKFLWLLFLDRLTPLVVLCLVLLFSIPTEFYRDLQIEKALKKIRHHKNLLVIGITGSYGKSSTKEYIAQILEKKFTVLKTKGTNNTPIGIAKTIISGLKKDTEVFVVEIGAYKRGEIAQMCQIVHPRIGVVTSVNNQHLSLFGTLKNTMDAKYELIEALPRDGLAIFNGNNENSFSLYCRAEREGKKKRILYRSFDSSVSIKMTRQKKDYINIVAHNIATEKLFISFDVILNFQNHRYRKISNLKIPLVGVHNVENVLPAIYIAYYLGMSELEIKRALTSFIPLPKTMIKHELRTGVTIIDDTFNANPNAVYAALEYMKSYKHKKILVLQPMIELGKKANIEHYQVAREISEVCDFLFLTNRNFYKSIYKGINDGGRKCKLKVGRISEIEEFINKRTKRGDIVVFEGKESAFVLDRVL